MSTAVTWCITMNSSGYENKGLSRGVLGLAYFYAKGVGACFEQPRLGPYTVLNTWYSVTTFVDEPARPP